MKLSKSAIELIKKHEGFSPVPYIDTEGYQTFGFGTKFPVTKDEAELILYKRADNLEEIKILFPNVESLSQARQDVLVNMYYNLGFNRLKGFVKFRAAVAAGDFETAVWEMICSKWHQQTKTRALELELIFAKGTY